MERRGARLAVKFVLKFVNRCLAQRGTKRQGATCTRQLKKEYFPSFFACDLFKSTFRLVGRLKYCAIIMVAVTRLLSIVLASASALAVPSVRRAAPAWQGQAVLGEEFVSIKSEDYKGKCKFLQTLCLGWATCLHVARRAGAIFLPTRFYFCVPD